MAKNLFRAASAAAVVLASMAIAATAHADEPPTSESAYIPTAMDEIFFKNTGSYNINRSIGGELGTMFGVGGFPEQNILEDGYAVLNAYEYLLEQQARVDPTIRVPDLVNPYSTSILYLPSSSPGVVSGSEFIFE